ncbi:MAG: diguanylate cyclase domain-containing protein [Dehalococcoidia bacterium]
MPLPRLPIRIYLLISATAAVAVVASALALSSTSLAVARDNIWLAAVLFAIFALAARFPLHLAPKFQQELSSAPGVAAAMLLQPGMAMLICASAHLSAETGRARGRPAQAVFNTAMVALQAGAAATAVKLIEGRLAMETTGGGLATLGAAIAVWFVVGTVFVETIIAVQLRRIPGRNWIGRQGQATTVEFSLLFIGAFAALLADVRPWLLPLMTVPVAVMYRAFSNQQLNLHRAQERRQFAELRRETAEQARERLTTIVDATPDVVLTLDSESRLQYANPAARAIFGLQEDEDLEGFPIESVFPAWKRSVVAATAAGIWSGESEIRGGGRAVPVSQVIIVHRGRSDEINFISTVARDIRDRKAFEEKLLHMAHHDPLTGAFNRRRFEDEVEASLVRAGRERGQGAVFYIDLDGFKSVNDRFGHRAGDRLLEAFVAALKAHPQIRESGLLGRLGGDEFALLMKGISTQEVSDLANEILGLVGGLRIGVGLEEAWVTASVGVALFNGSEQCDEVLARADSAMYEAKRAGNRVAFAPSGRGRLSA